MYYEKRKRAKMDRCNICGQTLPLTWDHVPPKFCDNYRSKEYNLRFGVDQHSNKEFPWTSQDGIKFRSLCNHAIMNCLALNMMLIIATLSTKLNCVWIHHYIFHRLCIMRLLSIE